MADKKITELPVVLLAGIDPSVDVFPVVTAADGITKQSTIAAAVLSVVSSLGASGVTSVNTRTGNVTLTKSDVGLSNVDNTSDVNKPVSTATQTALNTKQDTLVSATNIKTVNGTSILGSGDVSVGSSMGRKLITGTDTLVVGDLGKMVKCSGTTDYTVTLSAAATLGNNWFVSLSNEGTGIVTLSATSIDGASTKLIQPGDALFIQCNGTDLVTQRLDGEATFGTVSSPTVLASTASTSFVGCCALTSTNGFVLRKNASSFPIVDYVDSTGAIVATSSALESTAVSASMASIYMERISNTDALIIWARTSGAPVACVVRYNSGFTIGTVVQIDSSSNGHGGAVLSTTEAIVAWGNSTAAVVKATVLSISGTTLTLNTIYTLDSNNHTSAIRVARISATQAIAHYNLGNDTPQGLGKVITNTATVLTFPTTADSLCRCIAGANGSGSIVALTSPAGRALIVAGASSGSHTRAFTVDGTGTGTSGKLTRGLHKVVSTSDLPYESLVVVGPLTVVRVSKTGDSAALALSVLTLRPDGGVREGRASATIARTSNGAGAMLIGTTIVVVYTDADNSNFPTIKTVALGTVA